MIYCDVVKKKPTACFNYKTKEIICKFLLENPRILYRALRGHQGAFVEGVCCWRLLVNTFNNVRRLSGYQLPKVSLRASGHLSVKAKWEL